MPFLSEEDIYNIQEEQQEHDIRCAIQCFIDMNVPDIRILELLQKHFGMDTISQGQQYIKESRITSQRNKLQEYLGLTGCDWVHYNHTNHVIEKLESNDKLLELPPEKLKAAIEKK